MTINNNFWVRVSKEQDTFTKKEKVIINYIANSTNNINHITISALSKANNVGYSVIYSLIKKLGFKGYREFIINIATEENTYKVLNRELFENYSILKETYRRLLDLNDSAIDYNKLEKFILWINQNRDSIFYITGIGQSALGAEDLALKLHHIGIKAFCLNKDDDSLLIHSSVLKKTDILIIFSLSGKTEAIIKAVQIAKENEATVVAITSQEKSLLNNYADWIFTIISSGLYEEKTIFISPLFAMAYFNDLIITYLLQLPEKDWYLKNRLKTYKVVKKIN